MLLGYAWLRVRRSAAIEEALRVMQTTSRARVQVTRRRDRVRAASRSSQALVCHCARGKVPAAFLSLSGTPLFPVGISNVRKKQDAGAHIFRSPPQYRGSAGPGQVSRTRVPRPRRIRPDGRRTAPPDHAGPQADVAGLPRPDAGPRPGAAGRGAGRRTTSPGPGRTPAGTAGLGPVFGPGAGSAAYGSFRRGGGNSPFTTRRLEGEG